LDAEFRGHTVRLNAPICGHALAVPNPEKYFFYYSVPRKFGTEMRDDLVNLGLADKIDQALEGTTAADSPQ
jgi:hypothetical protein